MIGINTSVDAKCADMHAVLNEIAAAGFGGVMIHEKAGDLCGTIKYAQSLSLEIPFVHLEYDNLMDLWSPDKLARDREMAHKIKSMEICAQHGIKTVVIHPIHLRHGAPFDQDRAIGLASFNELASVAKRIDMKIALENLDRYNIDALYFLLDNIAVPNVGLCFDAGHWYLWRPGDDMPILDKYGTRLFAIHLQDNIREPFGADDQHLIPGDGKIDFPRVMRAIAQTGYRGCTMLEVRRINFHHDFIYNYPNLTRPQFLARAKSVALELSKYTQ